MSSDKPFVEVVKEASDDELRDMYRNLPRFLSTKQGVIKREMELRGLLADEVHRERESKHMDAVERQGRLQNILGFTALGIQLVPTGTALSVGFILGLTLGRRAP